MKEFWRFCSDIYHHKRLLLRFSLNDFKSRYAGSMLGIFWAFVSPAVMIATYWFVFSYGLRAGQSAGYPFIVFLVTGLVPWFFFSDSLTSATNVFRDYNYLVKKVVFNIRILPTAKLLSNFYTHFFFLILTFGVSISYGYFPTVMTLQLLYYLLCMIAILTGLTWITASIQPFVPDITQFINVFMQALMWASPVMWAPGTFGPNIERFLKLNPLYYVISGYRQAILNQGWFWFHPTQTIYFWGVTIFLLLLGSTMYKRLSPHFSDVL